MNKWRGVTGPMQRGFSEIDNLHSEWSRMEKAARLGWLSGEKARLTGLANQFSLYIYAKGGLMNDSERAYARKLLDMINSVDAEGSKVMDDLRNEAFKEIVKSLMKQYNSSHRTYVQLERLTGISRGIIQFAKT